jgi:tetratricopeptide (TPR) repeat protein
MGNHPLAIQDFNSAIDLDFDLSEGYFRRGFSKFYSQNYNEAIIDFKTAEEKERLHLETDPNLIKNAGIPDGLGCCYHALEQFVDAIDNYNTAITMDPSNTQFLMHRSQCKYDQGQFEDSINDLNEGLAINPIDPQVLYKLGLSYYADEKFKMCVSTLKKALMNSPYISYEADIYYHIGLAYCNVEKYEKSIYPFSRVSKSLSVYFCKVR